MIIPRVFFRSRVFGVATVLFTVIVLGSAIQPYLKRYQNAVSSSGPEQLFNTIFVTTGGYPLFSVCLFALCPPTKPILFLYAANTTFGLIFTTWFLGPLIFSRWDIWLGGHCGGIASDGSCTSWVSVFDVSGHAYATTSMTLALVAAVECIRTPGVTLSIPSNRSSLEWPLFIMLRLRYVGANGLGQALAAVLITAWLSMLTVTSLFFHKFTEKLIGYFLGAAVPLGWYIWVDSNNPQVLQISPAEIESHSSTI